MDAAFKAKWLPALRSDKYRQGKGRLRDGGGHFRHSDRFCCLGVACDLADPTGWTPNNYFLYKGESRIGQLPRPLANELGIDIGQENALVRMNDNGNPFPTIADWIEENL